jgi:CRP-like cAMP-binding protein
MKYPDLYKYYSGFCEIPVEDWLKLERHSKPVHFQQGDTLFKNGDKPTYAYSIRSGIVKNYYTTFEGKEFIKIFLSDGQMVSPYIEAIIGTPSRTTAEAITDVDSVAIRLDNMVSVLESTPALTKLHLRMVQMFYRLKEQREYELLTLDAKQRYDNFLDQYSYLVDRIPNMYIASYLGITPASLSRLRSSHQANQ